MAAEQPPPALKKVALLQGASGSFVGFSGDGSALVTAGGKDARVWDARTFKPRTEPLAHQGRVVFVSIDRGGGIVATGAGKAAVIWDAGMFARLVVVGKCLPDTERRSLDTFDLNMQGAKAVCFNRDGSKLLVAGEWGIQLWDVATDKLVGDALRAQMRSPAHDVLLSPDASLALIAPNTDDSGLWHVASGKQLLCLRGVPTADEAYGIAMKRITDVPVIAMTPSGTFVAASFNGSGLKDVWEMGGTKELKGHTTDTNNGKPE